VAFQLTRLYTFGRVRTRQWKRHLQCVFIYSWTTVLICLHSVLDKAGSQSVFKRTQNPRIFIHLFNKLPGHIIILVHIRFYWCSDACYCIFFKLCFNNRSSYFSTFPETRRSSQDLPIVSHVNFHQKSNTLAYVPEDIVMHSLYAKITFVNAPWFPDVYFVSFNNCVFIVFSVDIVLGHNICVCHLLYNKEISDLPPSASELVSWLKCTSE